MIMKNGNLLTKVEVKGGNTTGFEYIEKKNYKDLVVVSSSEGEVEAGEVIRVPITSGTETDLNEEDYIIVNIREIIFIH